MDAPEFTDADGAALIADEHLAHATGAARALPADSHDDRAFAALIDAQLATAHQLAALRATVAQAGDQLAAAARNGARR